MQACCFRHDGVQLFSFLSFLGFYLPAEYGVFSLLNLLLLFLIRLRGLHFYLILVYITSLAYNGGFHCARRLLSAKVFCLFKLNEESE